MSVIAVKAPLRAPIWVRFWMLTERKNRQPRGSGKAQSKINENQVREIRQLWKGGWKNKDLCAKFGLSASFISQVYNYKRWTHVLV
jgi:hypothetical protein